MSTHSIDWSVSIKASNGVFVTEFDCTVECELKRHYGDPDPFLVVDAILVTNGSLRSEIEVTDLLNPQQGLLPLGQIAKEILEKDEGLFEKAMDQRDEYQFGDRTDHARALVLAD